MTARADSIWMQSLGCAFFAQFHPKMLVLSFLPMMLSLFVWGALLWLGLPWFKDQVQIYLLGFSSFQSIGSGWTQLGLLAAQALLVPLVALWLLLPLILLAHTILWGWLTWRVMIYDALAEHASEDEYQAILAQHRWPLLEIGIVSSVIGNFPATLWLGGALTVVILPITATLSIWLYLLIFIFTGLWFQYYALMALHTWRQHNEMVIEASCRIVAEVELIPQARLRRTD